MWVFRELLRLFGRIAVAVLIAARAARRATASTGADPTQTPSAVFIGSGLAVLALGVFL